MDLTLVQQTAGMLIACCAARLWHSLLSWPLTVCVWPCSCDPAVTCHPQCWDYRCAPPPPSLNLLLTVSQRLWHPVTSIVTQGSSFLLRHFQLSILKLEVADFFLMGQRNISPNQFLPSRLCPRFWTELEGTLKALSSASAAGPPSPWTDRLCAPLGLGIQSLSHALLSFGPSPIFPILAASSQPETLCHFSHWPTTFCGPVYPRFSCLVIWDGASQLMLGTHAECEASLLSRAEFHEGVENATWIPRLQVA